MSNNTLTVNFDINNRPAHQALQEVKLDLTGVERAIMNSSMQLSRVINNQTSEMLRMFDRTKNETVEATKKQESFTGALIKSGLAMQGISKGIELMALFGEASKQAIEYNKQITQTLIKQLDAERELQALRGKNSTPETALETIRAAKQAGLTPEAMRNFQTEFLNSGAQFVGKTMTEEQSKKFGIQAASLSAKTGIGPDVIGDLAGKIMGQHDYSKEGEAGVNEAFKRLAQTQAILAAGSGGNTQLMSQQARTMASLMSENSQQGVFSRPQDVATLVSTFAEFNPEEANVYARASLRGLRDFDDKKTGALLKRAGITPQTDTMEAIEKLAPLVNAEAQQGNLKTYDVLNKYFADERTTTALSVLINKGVGPNGTFAARKQVEDATTTEGTLKAIKEAQADKRGPIAQTIADTTIKEAEAMRAQERLSYEAVSKQSQARLISKGEIETGPANFEEGLADKLNFLNGLRGHKGARAQRIDTETLKQLEQQNAVMGGPVPEKAFQIAKSYAGYEDNERAITKIIEALDKASEKMLAAAEAQELKNKPQPVQTKPTPGGGRAAVAR